MIMAWQAGPGPHSSSGRGVVRTIGPHESLGELALFASPVF